MSWFSRKKVPKVPFPAGHPAGEGALRFPSMKPEERIIEPAKVKEAVGFEMPSITEEIPSLPTLPAFEEFLPEPEEKRAMPRSEEERVPLPSVSKAAPLSFISKPESEPLFVKVDVYQRVLGEMEAMKKDIDDAFESSKHLESSEYNEEENYAKLKRAVRIVHDRLLQVDKTLFKVQGD